jgi:hypothetical protein
MRTRNGTRRDQILEVNARTCNTLIVLIELSPSIDTTGEQGWWVACFLELCVRLEG